MLVKSVINVLLVRLLIHLLVNVQVVIQGSKFVHLVILGRQNAINVLDVLGGGIFGVVLVTVHVLLYTHGAESVENVIHVLRVHRLILTLAPVSNRSIYYFFGFCFSR